MKKIILTFAVLTIFTLILTACAGSAQTGTQAASVTLTENYTDAASAETQLALGTIKLEETEQAVGAEQAAELIPLWQLLQTLKSKDSTAPQEVAAVVEKIESVMTADQIKLITAMKITQQDAISAMQGQASSTGKSSTAQSNNNFAGGPPPDAMGGIPGQGMVLNQSAPATTSKAQTSLDSSSSSLLDTLIKLLQKKTQA